MSFVSGAARGTYTGHYKGGLSVATNRLLKSVLPASCLWTSLRESEGFGYNETLVELKTIYPAEDTMDDEEILGEAVPQSIRDMLWCKSAMEALGVMIWSVSILAESWNIPDI
jgi:DNA mismatch repair protein MSH6